MYMTAGNHDIGFNIIPSAAKRFTDSTKYPLNYEAALPFNTSLVVVNTIGLHQPKTPFGNDAFGFLNEFKKSPGKTIIFILMTIQANAL